MPMNLDLPHTAQVKLLHCKLHAPHTRLLKTWPVRD
jgi:hypothetical protein